MSRPISIANRPSEILDHICSFVDSPKDILSFALTSKEVCQLAIPDHIEFRHLRCDIRRISLWKKLAELPAVASRFVSLEVAVEVGTDHRSPILPIRSRLLAHRDQTEDVLFKWDPGPESFRELDEGESDPNKRARNLHLSSAYTHWQPPCRACRALLAFIG
jgi:hypothetical protein